MLPQYTLTYFVVVLHRVLTFKAVHSVFIVSDELYEKFAKIQDSINRFSNTTSSYLLKADHLRRNDMSFSLCV